MLVDVTLEDIRKWKEEIGMDYQVGPVSDCPGCYCIGKGIYTGELGWEAFNKAIIKVANENFASNNNV